MLLKLFLKFKLKKCKLNSIFKLKIEVKARIVVLDRCRHGCFIYFPDDTVGFFEAHLLSHYSDVCIV